MSFPVIKHAAYILAAAPDMLVHNGTTQTMEREANPDSDYLKKLQEHLRSFEEVVGYAPNQTYIGNMSPEELAARKRPWYDELIADASRFGPYGEIMPQDEFYGLMKVADVFDLVLLESGYTKQLQETFAKHPLLQAKAAALTAGEELAQITSLVDVGAADGLYASGRLVGCVKKAHDVDRNLTAHIMLENLVTKASGVLAVMHLLKNSGVDPAEVGYMIECSEEAVGDMNQRGGGNMAKAVGEIAGVTGASGIDMRGFCAGPAHALVNAAALVKSGIFKNVIVFAGGCTAKLGMNGRDHVKKSMPLLEDCVGGFAVLISENDGVSPELRTDIIGRHKISSGAAPQAVLEALVLNPLRENNMKITDIDKFAPEMQTPDITEPAGAGDVPTQNYKMIGALAVKNGQLERKELPQFIVKHGYPGFAPTQGHIPSGVPVIGHGIDKIRAGELDNFMVIGKGSLFLGRMTNLFDGISFVVAKNSGETATNNTGATKEEVRTMVSEAFNEFAKYLMKE